MLLCIPGFSTAVKAGHLYLIAHFFFSDSANEQSAPIHTQNILLQDFLTGCLRQS